MKNSFWNFDTFSISHLEAANKDRVGRGSQIPSKKRLAGGIFVDPKSLKLLIQTKIYLQKSWEKEDGVWAQALTNKLAI